MRPRVGFARPGWLVWYARAMLLVFFGICGYDVDFFHCTQTIIVYGCALVCYTTTTTVRFSAQARVCTRVQFACSARLWRLFTMNACVVRPYAAHDSFKYRIITRGTDYNK